MRLTVTNTEVETLRELQRLWGGCVSNRREIGRKPHWKPAHDLIWAGTTAAEVLREVQPYLRIKAEQCRVALEFASTVNPSEHRTRPIPEQVSEYRQDLRAEMLSLNARGANRIALDSR